MRGIYYSVLTSVVFIFVYISHVANADESFSVPSLHLYTQNFRPFHYTYGGEAEGPVVDLVRQVCVEVKVHCVIEVVPWTRAQEEVRLGKAHGLFVVGRNAERESWLHFSVPIIMSEYGFFSVESRLLAYKQPRDLVGKKIGVYGPSNTEISLRLLRQQMVQLELEPFDISVFEQDRVAFDELKGGYVDAVYSNRQVGEALFRVKGGGSVVYTAKHRDLAYHLGFSQSVVDRDLVGRFNSALNALLQSPLAAELLAPIGVKVTAGQLE